MSVLKKEVVKLDENNIQLRIIGDKSRFRKGCKSKLRKQKKQQERPINLNIAANYGGQ